MFETTTYVSRRHVLTKAMQGLGIFPANPVSPMNFAANCYPYFQDSCFAYYFGIAQPSLVGVSDFDTGEHYLFGGEPSLDEMIWLGSYQPLAELAGQSGVDGALPLDRLGEWLQVRQRDRLIHYAPPYRNTITLQLSHWLNLPASAVTARASAPLIRAMITQREIKSAEEIAEMEAALAVTAEMHHTAMRAARPDVMEHHVAGMVEGVARAADCRLAYPVIFSARGEILHNDKHDHRLAAGDLVVHDSGAMSQIGYAADITRTLPIGGHFGDKQRTCYELVLQAQDAAINACRPGATYLSVHKLAARILVEGLVAEGVFRGDPDMIVESGAYALCFQTGVGHQIGLDVHDMEALGEDFVGYDQTVDRSQKFGLKNLRMAKTLREGMVVTVEPGLYFIPMLMDRWEGEGLYKGMIDYDRARSFLGVHGIRIEDDVLITSTGAQVLGPKIPKRTEDIEAALQC